MLDINQIRADFAGYLQAHAASRHSLDAALMHVVEMAYRQGYTDALHVPAVFTESVENLDPGLAPGMRSPMAAVPHAGPAPRAPGASAGGETRGRAAVGTDATAPDHGIAHFYGCNLRGYPVFPPRCNHTFKATDPACSGCARRVDTP